MIIIALPKGRLLPSCIKHLDKLGLIKKPIENDRQLSHKISDDMTIFIVRNSDVISYIKNNIADIALVGSDMLLEDWDNGASYYDHGGVNFSSCCLMVAGRKQAADHNNNKQSKVRVATKYQRVANDFYSSRGIQAEIIKINGSVELAASAGFVDHIVDIVDTGKTLKENNLVPLEKIADVTTRVIINKGIMKTKWRSISLLANKLVD